MTENWQKIYLAGAAVVLFLIFQPQPASPPVQPLAPVVPAPCPEPDPEPDQPTPKPGPPRRP